MQKYKYCWDSSLYQSNLFLAWWQEIQVHRIMCKRMQKYLVNVGKALNCRYLLNICHVFQSIKKNQSWFQSCEASICSSIILLKIMRVKPSKKFWKMGNYTKEKINDLKHRFSGPVPTFPFLANSWLKRCLINLPSMAIHSDNGIKWTCTHAF